MLFESSLFLLNSFVYDTVYIYGCILLNGGCRYTLCLAFVFYNMKDLTILADALNVVFMFSINKRQKQDND